MDDDTKRELTELLESARRRNGGNGWRQSALQAAGAVIIFLLGVIVTANALRVASIEQRLADVIRSRDERNGWMERLERRLETLERSVHIQP